MRWFSTLPQILASRPRAMMAYSRASCAVSFRETSKARAAASKAGPRFALVAGSVSCRGAGRGVMGSSAYSLEDSSSLLRSGLAMTTKSRFLAALGMTTRKRGSKRVIVERGGRLGDSDYGETWVRRRRGKPRLYRRDSAEARAKSGMVLGYQE